MLALAGVVSPARVGAGEISTQNHTAGTWRLTVRTDYFSNERFCRLRSRNQKMIYVANAIGFRVGRNLDIQHAFFRVDDGEPQRWRDQLPELARLRVAIDGRDMDRPTDGIVWLPTSLLNDAEQVTIQSRPGKRPKKFALRRLAEIREIARESGCTPETRFVR